MDNRATRLEPPKWGVFQLSLLYSKKKKGSKPKRAGAEPPVAALAALKTKRQRSCVRFCFWMRPKRDPGSANSSTLKDWGPKSVDVNSGRGCHGNGPKEERPAI